MLCPFSEPLTPLCLAESAAAAVSHPVMRPPEVLKEELFFDCI